MCFLKTAERVLLLKIKQQDHFDIRKAQQMIQVIPKRGLTVQVYAETPPSYLKGACGQEDFEQKVVIKVRVLQYLFLLRYQEPADTVESCMFIINNININGLCGIF